MRNGRIDLPEAAPEPKLSIDRISVPKASDVLADRLREAIMAGQIKLGTSLPSERQMMAQSGLSRTSVREALRILELQGLVEIRAGRNGGAYVRRPDLDSVTRSLDLLIQGHRIRYQDLLAVREAIEPVAAAQAAERRTAEDLERIEMLTRRCEESVDHLPEFLQANLEWHLAVVAASHNPLFVAFVTSIAPAIHSATDLQELNAEDVRPLVLRAHRRIFEAIQAGSPSAARRRMERHVAAYAAQAGEVDPARLEGTELALAR